MFFRIYTTFLFAALGAVLGSFLNCAAMRYGKGETVPRGRSHCPKCGHILGAAELVPIFSYLALGGRCKECHEKILVRYPLTELIGAASFAGLYLRFGLTLYTAELAVLFSVLLLLALIDFDTMLLPVPPMILACAGFFVFLPAHENWKQRLMEGGLTAIVVFAVLLALALVMDRILKRESLGGGDLKLMALSALYLGPMRTILMLEVSCVLALLFAAVTGAFKKRFPFGPSICMGTALTLLFGDPVIALLFPAL